MVLIDEKKARIRQEEHVHPRPLTSFLCWPHVAVTVDENRTCRNEIQIYGREKVQQNHISNGVYERECMLSTSPKA